MTVEQRREIEKKIITKALDTIISAGYEVSVFDGEAIVIKRSTNTNNILEKLFSVDDESLLIYKPNEKNRIGCVQLVYGNDGWDVLADSSNQVVEELLQPASKLADEICENWPV